MTSDTLPALRSRLEALADWLTEHVKTLPTETRVWPNKLAGYIDTLRTVLALLAEPGEEEVRALIQAAREWSPPGGVAQLLADAVERLAVRLEAEKRECQKHKEEARRMMHYGEDPPR